MERLQKIISQAGICSRRQAEELILCKVVFVNDKLAKLGDKADISKDKIVVNKKEIKLNQDKKFVYYLVNKPKDYLCSTRRHKKTDNIITDLVPAEPKVYPVGRLDKNSTGLIILTNDGDFTQKYTHPKFEHEKEYEVDVFKTLTKDFLQKMKSGIKLQEGIAKADKISKISDNRFRIVLHQGWNRQIRRMCESLNFKIANLKRIRIGEFKLEDLEEGECKIVNS